MAIIPTHLLCQMLANPRLHKYRKRNKILSLLVYVVVVQKRAKKCTKTAWCTCKVVVLQIKPIVFLTFSLPSASLDLKVPYITTAPPPNLTRLLYNTASYAGYEKTGPPFEVDHFFRSDRSEFWLNGSRPLIVLRSKSPAIGFPSNHLPSNVKSYEY